MDALQRHNDYVVTPLRHYFREYHIMDNFVYAFCYKTIKKEVKSCASRALSKEKARVKKGRAALLSESESSIYEAGTALALLRWNRRV